MEWSRALVEDWLRFYSNLGAGVRIERLLLRDADESDESESSVRAVAAAEAGLEFDAIRMSRRTRLRLRSTRLGIGLKSLRLKRTDFRIRSPH